MDKKKIRVISECKTEMSLIKSIVFFFHLNFRSGLLDIGSQLIIIYFFLSAFSIVCVDVAILAHAIGI